MFCDGNRVVRCDCYDNYPNGGYGRRLEVLSTCEGATACTPLAEGTLDDEHATGWPKLAQCVEHCATPGAARCAVGDDGPTWTVCAAPTTDAAGLQALVLAFVDGMAAAAPGAVHGWRDAHVACMPCSSDCGCPVGRRCRGGYCFPPHLVGPVPDGLVCCGREHGTACPTGAPCTTLDGATSTCTTAARCEPCESDPECESDALVCASASPAVPTVCLTPADLGGSTHACHDTLNQVWLRDVCGRWITRVTDCGTARRCDVDACVPRAPEIEVSPTLLSFGSAKVGLAKTLTLSVGNLGDADLVVSEVAVEASVAAQFAVSTVTMTVAAGQIADITVTFSPQTTGTVSGKLFVRSNDADEAEVTVLMNGTGTP